MNYNTIIINCNPETMSTDFDESEKLYFEELTLERVLDIYQKENANGIIVSMGGQEPNNIALKLHRQGANILGTSPESIDLCENRFKYSNLLDDLNINQPDWTVSSNEIDMLNFVEKVGYPVVVRPSYVLSGAAMRIIDNISSLKKCITDAQNISPEYPVVVTKFIQDAQEVDVDAIISDGEIVTYAISEHVENAGIHSGDATMILPPYTITKNAQDKMLSIITNIGKKLKVKGPLNTQFLLKDNWVGVIETNLRCSRSIPFVSKTLGIDFINIGVKAIMDEVVETTIPPKIKYYGVKCPQFSFARLPNADPILGIEMRSTGEVACFGKTIEEAYIKSLIASRSGFYNKDNMNILKVGDTDDINTNIFIQKGHNIINYVEKDFPNNTYTWDDIDMVIDCTNSINTQNVRRNAIDYSKYLVTINNK